MRNSRFYFSFVRLVHNSCPREGNFSKNVIKACGIGCFTIYTLYEYGVFRSFSLCHSEKQPKKTIYDFVVIGAGISGTASLYGILSTKPGYSVLVIEKNRGRFHQALQTTSSIISELNLGNACPLSTVERVESIQGVAATNIDPERKLVTLQGNNSVQYKYACLLATGCQTDSTDGLHHDISDSALSHVVRLHELNHRHGGVESVRAVHSALPSAALSPEPDRQGPLQRRPHITIVGGGAAACELAGRLASGDGEECGAADVALVCGGPGLMAEAAPHELGGQLACSLRRLGVDVMTYTSLQYCRLDGSGEEAGPVEVFLSRTFDRLSTARLRTDLVVLAQESLPADTRLASQANGLEVVPEPVGGGFGVNCELAARSGVYVAGDAASVPHPAAHGRRAGLRGAEAAARSGFLAGQNMATTCTEYGGGMGLAAGRRYQAVAYADPLRLDGADGGPDLGFRMDWVGRTGRDLPTVSIWSMRRWQLSSAAGVSSIAAEPSPVGSSSPEVDAKPIDPAVATDVMVSGQSGVLGRISDALTSIAGGSLSPSTAVTTAGTGSVNEEETPPAYVGFGCGVVYYLENQRIVGGLLFNLPSPDAKEALRAAIASGYLVNNPESLRVLVPVPTNQSGGRAFLRASPARTASMGLRRIPSRTRGPGEGGHDRWTRAIFGQLPEERTR